MNGEPTKASVDDEEKVVIFYLELIFTSDWRLQSGRYPPSAPLTVGPGYRRAEAGEQPPGSTCC